MTANNRPPTVMTPAMLAERWACSERHIRNIIALGKLRAFRIGGTLLRIRGQDVESFEGQDQISGESPSLNEGLAFPVAKDPVAAVLPLEPTIRKRRPPVRRLDRR